MKIISNTTSGSMRRQWHQALPTLEPWAFYIPANSAVEEPNGQVWSSPYPVIAFFIPGKWYQIFMLLKEERTDYYCNVTTPVVYVSSEKVLRFVDLELDVRVEGRQVLLEDEAEFEAASLHYPKEWIEEAARAAKELQALATERRGPFSPATIAWWRAYGERFFEELK